jgi:hypothetical protein
VNGEPLSPFIPAAPLSPPPVSPSFRAKGGVNATALDDKRKDLNPTSLEKQPPKGNPNRSALEEALERRRGAVTGNGDDETGENNDDEWKDEAKPDPRQILYSPSSGPRTELRMECDASNVAHVTGLAMALEYRMALGDPLVQTPDMEHVIAIVQKHARTLEKSSLSAAAAAEVPLEVSTAIYTITDTLSSQTY